MNNLTITKNENNLSTVTIGGMTAGKMHDWAIILLGTAVVTETEEGNWKYVITIEDVTESGLDRLRGYDFSFYPDNSAHPLQKGVDIAVTNVMTSIPHGFQFRGKNGFMATYLLKGSGYIFIVETETGHLFLKTVREADLTDFYNS